MTNSAITMAIDIKKHRIRLHKNTLHMLLDPKYIQLLINTEKKQIAIKGLDTMTSGDQTYNIDAGNICTDESCDIYSDNLVKALYFLVETLDFKSTYRLTGQLIKSHRLVLFDLSTLERIEG